MPAEGGEPVPVGKNLGVAAGEGGDGNSLYYFRDRAVWRSDLSGANEIRVIDASDFQEFRVCGKEVCVLDNSSPPSAEFVRYDPVTKRKQTKLLDIGPRIYTSLGMDVSPDGRWVIFTRADSVESDIMMVENFH